MNFLKIFNINLAVAKDVEGYEDLQKRINEKSEFLEKVLTSFNELSKYLKDVFKKILLFNSNFSNITFSLEEQNIQETCKLVYQKIINSLEEENKLVEDILKILVEHIKGFHIEKAKYDELKKLGKELKEEKERLNKNKELYFKVGKESEEKIKKFVKTNYNTLSDLAPELKEELNTYIVPPKRALTNYKSSVEKVNLLVNKFNQKQAELYDYLPELGSNDGVFFFRLVKLYLQCLDAGEKYLNSNKKNLNESQTLETDSKLKELIEISENNKTEEKPIELMQYQSGLDFNKCKDKEEFDIFAKSAETINTNISPEIFPNYSYENELKNFEEYRLIKLIFETKDFDKEKKYNEFIESLKDESTHRTVFIALSHLRTSSKFQKEKDIIELLGKAFNILLGYAQKKKLYENAKNCIILSQTYYFLDENKKKIYSFEYIKKNRWLSSSHFWRNFIDYMITKEIERFEKSYPRHVFSVQEEIGVADKIKERLNEVVFSQLLPFISGMIDFEIDKRVVIKIADEFFEKYNYLSKTNLQSILGVISQDKDELEKLRKEYSPSLEPPLEEEIIEEKEEKVKDDVKEEKQEKVETKEEKEEKEEKKEEKKENEKKEDNEPKEEKETKEEKVIVKEDNEPKEEIKENEDNKNEVKEKEPKENDEGVKEEGKENKNEEENK